LKSLLVFGSINLDISTRVRRLPLPGETLMGSDLHVSPGGKGANQAHAARLFCAPVRMVGAVGDDAFAQAALVDLERSGTHLSGVRRLRSAATGVATISVMPDGENSIVVAPGANDEVRCEWVGDEVVAATSLLLLQLEVPPAESMALARRVKARGGRVMWNLAPARSLSAVDATCVDWLVVNRTELAALAATLGLDASQPEACAGRIATTSGCTVIVTLGAGGAIACLPQGGRIGVEALPTQATDATGAGDTFCGVLAAALHEGYGIHSALIHANAAASLACRRAGAQSAQPVRREIEEAIR
jgi:ribokinase